MRCMYSCLIISNSFWRIKIVKHSVPEYVFYVFLRFQKTWLFTFFETTYQKVVKVTKKYWLTANHSCSARAKRTLFSAKSARTLAHFIMRTLKIDNKRTFQRTLYSSNSAHCWLPYAKNPLHTFPRNFSVDGEAADLLRGTRCNGFWQV